MSSPEDPVIAALRASLDSNPRNPDVWSHLAELLLGHGRTDEAIDALRNALQTGAAVAETTVRILPLLIEREQISEALIRAEQALEQVGSHSAIEGQLARIHELRGDHEAAAELSASAGTTNESPTTQSAPLPTPREEPEELEEPRETEERRAEAAEIDMEGHSQEELDDWASQFDWDDLRVTFDDVAGLDDVKRQIRLRVIAPQENRQVFEAFQRKAGGGILLYGPPGCGKTFIAKATAGESGARFVSVGIHEVMDKYWGESEKLIHALFDDARRRTPTVLFFDEFDALGGARGSTGSQFWRVMVDQLLQEMDGLTGRNDDILVFAATNVPWHIDSAFRRPGRFDRAFFVPPPDAAGRHAILERHTQKLPGGDKIPVKKLVKSTSLWTGADLVALCERASEESLERSLETGEIVPVTFDHFTREIGRMDSSALEWLATAKNHAQFANQGGQYDDLAAFLKRVKRW